MARCRPNAVTSALMALNKARLARAVCKCRGRAWRTPAASVLAGPATPVLAETSAGRRSPQQPSLASSSAERGGVSTGLSCRRGDRRMKPRYSCFLVEREVARTRHDKQPPGTDFVSVRAVPDQLNCNYTRKTARTSASPGAQFDVLPDDRFLQNRRAADRSSLKSGAASPLKVRRNAQCPGATAAAAVGGRRNARVSSADGKATTVGTVTWAASGIAASIGVQILHADPCLRGSKIARR